MHTQRFLTIHNLIQHLNEEHKMNVISDIRGIYVMESTEEENLSTAMSNNVVYEHQTHLNYHRQAKGKGGRQSHKEPRRLILSVLHISNQYSILTVLSHILHDTY